MATNMTLSLTVNDEAQQQLAANILSDAFDRLIAAMPDVTSISLSVFTDEFAAQGESTEEVTGRRIPIREASPEGTSVAWASDVEPRP